MTLVAKVDNVALPDGALLIGGAPNSSIPGGIVGLPTAAYFGEAMFGGLSIDDPDGDYDFDGLHTFTVDETADTDRPRIWNGLLTGRRVHRGPYKSGVSRIWDVDIWEMNLLFNLMVFRASSAKRPYETDLVRAEYIIESAPMAWTPTVDNGRANFTDNPINFDEADLVTRFPIEAINEFASIAGKNFYNYWDQDLEENSFHYDLIGVGPAASVTITNDEADTLDSTTFRPFLDAELDEGAEWTVTGMLLGFKGAYAYRIRQATIDSLSPTIFSPVEFQRDEVYRTDRIGRLATANAIADQMLLDRATDRATIKCSIRVPAAVVNEGIEAGDLITVKFTHLPGYETETDIPIIRRNVVPTEGRVDMYDVHLELSGVGKPTGPGGGGGPFPQEPCTGDGEDVFLGASSITTHPLPSNWFDDDDTTHNNVDPGGFDGWQVVDPQPIDTISILWYYRPPGAGGQGEFEVQGSNAGEGGPWTSVLFDADPWTTNGGSPSFDFINVYDLGAPVTYRFWRFTSSGSQTNDIQTFKGFQACEDRCPDAGQWVDPPEVVVLVGPDGVTRCPFADGSLHVYIDNVEQTDTLVSQSAGTGDFTLGFDPTPTEVCTVRYQGR